MANTLTLLVGNASGLRGILSQQLLLQTLKVRICNLSVIVELSLLHTLTQRQLPISLTQLAASVVLQSNLGRRRWAPCRMRRPRSVSLYRCSLRMRESLLLRQMLCHLLLADVLSANVGNIGLHRSMLGLRGMLYLMLLNGSLTQCFQNLGPGEALLRPCPTQMRLILGCPLRCQGVERLMRLGGCRLRSRSGRSNSHSMGRDVRGDLGHSCDRANSGVHGDVDDGTGRGGSSRRRWASGDSS